jgi:hypothetical protein
MPPSALAALAEAPAAGGEAARAAGAAMEAAAKDVGGASSAAADSIAAWAEQTGATVKAIGNTVATALRLMKSTADATAAAVRAAAEAMRDSAAAGMRAAADALAGPAAPAFAGTPHAAGLAYVPRDDYPALLHKGEAVLNSPDASAWRGGKGSGGTVDVHVDLSGAVVRSDGDIDRIAREILRKIEDARGNM